MWNYTSRSRRMPLQDPDLDFSRGPEVGPWIDPVG